MKVIANGIRDKFLTKRRKGFTLVEIIISIGIVAIISSSILELFITAGNLNRRAYDMDKSIMLCESVVEQFKSLTNPEDVLKLAFLKDADIPDSSKPYQAVIYYDKAWNVLKAGPDSKAKAWYSFHLNVGNIPDRDGMIAYHLSMYKNKFGYMEKKTPKSFYEVNISRYFWSNKGGLMK